MLIYAIKPGHDGGIAAVEDGRLLYCLEAEKDSNPRYSRLLPWAIIESARQCLKLPDVIALGGWLKTPALTQIGAGYIGSNSIMQETGFFGKSLTYFSSSHERSHIMMSIGMASSCETSLQTVLVWEGELGSFYLLTKSGQLVKKVPVMSGPGARYSLLFGLADPTYPDEGSNTRFGDSGKLMALAAYGDANSRDQEVIAAVDQILSLESVTPGSKAQLRRTALYNAGVESDIVKTAAAVLSRRIFARFEQAARKELPAGTPLRISGGCGLNCDWNSSWRNVPHFSDVFVPPCTNDSGSAIGTAIDAQFRLTGEYRIDWTVYSGLEFVNDTSPDARRWRHRKLDTAEVAEILCSGKVVAWIQGRWEIGPRALGSRSILAEPFTTEMRNRLNNLKLREAYRPIAPCCREEDIGRLSNDDFFDPYMLYVRRVRAGRLHAVTHVDGSARVQVVSRRTNARLHSLLGAVAERSGIGVLCNTSLNYSGQGFINRMTDLIDFCESRAIEEIIVNDEWYTYQS